MLKGLGLFSRHLRGKKAYICALFLLGLAGAATSLASPLIGKTFIDSVVAKHNYDLVPRIALALFGLAVADLILGACTRRVHTKLSAGVLVELRERLFGHCLHAPLAEMERFRQGDLLNRFSADITKIQTLLVDGFLGFIQNILFLIVAAVILLRLSLQLALWSFLGIFIALIITTAFRRPVERGTRIVREAMVDLSHFLTERLGALRAVRLHEAEVQDQQSFSAYNAALVRRLLKFQNLDAAASGFPALALAASLAWIYLLGGGADRKRSHNFGDLRRVYSVSGATGRPGYGNAGTDAHPSGSPGQPGSSGRGFVSRGCCCTGNAWINRTG